MEDADQNCENITPYKSHVPWLSSYSEVSWSVGYVTDHAAAS